MGAALAIALAIAIAIVDAGARASDETPPAAEPAEWRPLDARDERYPLDGLDRAVARTGPIVCPDVPMVVYRGQAIRYHKPVRVFESFRPRLVELEAVVRTVATEIYGRAPVRIRHAGTFNCRRIARYIDLLSEHGLGNAIDIEGFEFAAARSGGEARAAPRGLRGAFQVHLGTHWKAQRGVSAVHARFLETLARRLVDRPEIFRVLLGPAFPGHKSHFHFDMAPYRMIAIWRDPTVEPAAAAAASQTAPAPAAP